MLALLVEQHLQRVRPAISSGGGAMRKEDSEDRSNQEDAAQPTNQPPFAEGVAMAVAIGILAAFTFFLFRG